MSQRPQLPHDDEAERAVLGAILLRNETIALSPLEVDDFYDPRHKQIFGAMRNLEAQGRPIDTVTVGDELDRKDAQQGSAGTPLADACISVMASAALHVPVPESVEHYAAIVREHRTTRDLILRLDSVIARARAGEVRGDEAVSMASSVISGMDHGQSDVGKTMGQVVRDEFLSIQRDVDARGSGGTVHVGVPTGLRDLDQHLGGIPLGVVTVLAGRPGHGKTSLSQTLLRAASTLTLDEPIFYSYEDNESSFAQREIAAVTGVPTQSIRARDFNYGELGKIQNRTPQLKALKGVLVEAHGMSADALVRDVKRRRLRARVEGKSSCGLVIVDYLQRMPLPNGHGRTDEKLGWLMDKLVTLAATERIAVIVCSQLNRQIENREEKRPKLSDMRESGKIEELCKVALGVYRPAKTDPSADRNLLEIHILKNHQGEADVKADVYWDLATHTIVNSRSDLAGR